MWRCESTNSDGYKYYGYLLLYMDDCLAVSENPGSIPLGEIGKNFDFKEYLIGPPSQYLGGKMRKAKIKKGEIIMGVCIYPIRPSSRVK